MKIVDTENWAWFLSEHNGGQLLDANCSMSALSYTDMIRLNDAEALATKLDLID